jgi:glycosyltransferase involved in cell wall biosynthesis
MAQIRKKILILITQSSFGGAQKYVFDLATGLDKNKYEVAVAAGGDGELFERLKTADIQIFKRKCLKRPICPTCDIEAYFKLKRLFREWQPDILHLNSSKVSILGSLAARNMPIKVIYTVHGSVFQPPFSSFLSNLFLRLEKWTAKYKHKIICVSDNDRRLWLKYNVAPTEKLVTIHNGIGPEPLFLPKEEARRKILENNYEKLKDYKIVGFIGYFYPDKNLTTLIKSANLISNSPALKDKKIIFAIIGAGPQEAELKTLVKNLNLDEKVLFLGALPEAQRYLKAFDVFTQPSVKEGLPYTILQSMAAGTPIIASDVGGIPEMITDNFNGFLIKPHDAETLAERILQILENPDLAQEFKKNSLEKVKQFSLKKMIEQTEQQY